MPAGEFSFDITPQDAIDYLSKRRKTELSWHWSDVQKQEHMRAFTVAKMTSATLLDDVRQSLDKAMAEGQSFQEWRKDIIPKLQGVWLGKTYGDLWDGMTPAEQAGKTPPTPEERDRVIKASRLETIFRTNMFNAYAAGRYRQLKEDADIYPYWRYVTAKDSAVRPAHRALEGKVFKADDPFWSTHYPPNGFNCRCIVEAVDEYDLEMQDLKVQEGGNVYFDEENGQAVYRDAEGKEYPCDKGWDYNVGEDPTGQKTLAAKKFPPELTKAIREDLKTEAERLKAETEELEKARKQAEEESRHADAAQKAAEQAKKQAEAEAKRKAEEQRKAQAEAERKAKEQSQKAETEQKRFVVDVTRPSKPSKHPGKKATAEEQKRFVVDVTRPDKPSKRPGKKAAAEEQKRFVVDVTRPDKPSKRPGKKAAAEEQKRFVVDVTRPDKPSKRTAKKATEIIKTTPEAPAKLKLETNNEKNVEKQTSDLFDNIMQVYRRSGKYDEATEREIRQLCKSIVEVIDRDEPYEKTINSTSSTNNKQPNTSDDYIKIGNARYHKSQIFTNVTCDVEKRIRQAEEEHIKKMQADPDNENLNTVVDFRDMDMSNYKIERMYELMRIKALEFFVNYDPQTKEPLFGVLGTRGRVSFAGIDKKKYNRYGLGSVHNHPRQTFAFSMGDMRVCHQTRAPETALVIRNKVLIFEPYYKEMGADVVSKLCARAYKEAIEICEAKYRLLYNAMLELDDEHKELIRSFFKSKLPSIEVSVIDKYLRRYGKVTVKELKKLEG